MTPYPTTTTSSMSWAFSPHDHVDLRLIFYRHALGREADKGKLKGIALFGRNLVVTVKVTGRTYPLRQHGHVNTPSGGCCRCP